MVHRFVALLVLVPLIAAPLVVADPLPPLMVPPSPPMNVETTANGADVTVTWDAPVFYGGASSVTYRVYRGDALIADDLTSTVFVDTASMTTSAAATTYAVTAVNEAGESMRQGGACIQPDGPAVDPWACVGLVVDTVFWIVGVVEDLKDP